MAASVLPEIEKAGKKGEKGSSDDISKGTRYSHEAKLLGLPTAAAILLFSSCSRMSPSGLVSALSADSNLIR